MRKFLFSTFIGLASCSAYGQEDYNNFLSGMQIGILNSSAYTNAANTSAHGDFLLKSSMANINNQKAETIRLNNDMLKTSNYFEKRQMNLYHRSLYDLQKYEINKMRREGTLTKESLDSLFDNNVRVKTKFVGTDTLGFGNSKK